MKVFPKDKKTIVFTKGAYELATLTYDSRWSEKAGISFAVGNQYRIESQGIWKTGYVVRKGTRTIVSMRTKWTGNVALEIHETGNKASFTFRKKSFWNERYELIDKDNFVLGTIVSRFSWKSFSTDYELSFSPRFEALGQHVLLSVLLVFMLRSVMSHNGYVMIPA
jgi:hypothetical protein